MNILLINHYAGSPEMGMEFRPYYFAREWVRAGHHVDIVAADYSHLRIRNPKVQKDFQKEIIDGIHYHWIHTNTYEGNGIRRAVTMFQFVWKLWKNAKRIACIWRPDIVITSSTYPLDTYAGQRIRRYCKCKLVHEIHDMWPITPIEINGMSKYHPFILMLQLAENSFCKKADYIVSLLPYAKNYLIEHGMKAKKFIAIPNGVVLDEWESKEKLPKDIDRALDKLRKRYEFILCFFGSHTKSYALSYLIDAVKYFEKREIALVFVGNGNEKKNLQERSREYENIMFFDPIPKKCIPSLMDAIDGVYVGAVDNKMFRFGVCMNKLFDSMMGGKPILYAVNAPNNYIEEYKCGVSVQPESTGALVDGIKELLSKSPDERNRMGMNGKKAVKEVFNYRALAKKFEEIFIY